MKKIKRTVFPVLAAMIWGAAFSFQRSAAEHISTFTLNAVRSIYAVAALSIFLFLCRKKMPLPKEKEDRRQFLRGGLVCGVLLFVSANFQQAGLSGTEAGKAGFITALYIVLVPVFGIFLGKKARLRVWLCIVVAVVGMYFLCGGTEFQFRFSDLQVLLCAVCYAFHILAIDHYAKTTSNAVALSCAQFAVNAVLSLVCAFIFEEPSWGAIRSCWWDLFYIGVFSSAVAYTLQFVAQSAGEPVRVSLLFSLESVFSLIFGALLLKEYLKPIELVGCGIMFCAVMWAQLPHQWWKPKEERT